MLTSLRVRKTKGHEVVIAKNIIFLFIFSIFQATPLLAGQIIFEPLQPTQCQALPETKSYLSDPTSKNIVLFQCQYRCADRAGKLHFVNIQHQYKPNPSDDEMTSMVCKGIRIDLKKSELGYVLDQDIYVSNFWANFATEPELKNWVQLNQVTLPEETKNQMKKAMNQAFLKMAMDLLPQTSNSEDLRLYATQLLEIGSETTTGHNLLLELVKKIKNNETSSNTAETLLMMQVKFHGKFLFQ